MLRRICRDCGREMVKELTPEGPRFTCQSDDEHRHYDELDMEPCCPVCGEQLEFCAKCAQGFFCNCCKMMVSSKKIEWKAQPQEG